MRMKKTTERIGQQVNTQYKAGLFEILVFWKPFNPSATVLYLYPNPMFKGFQNMQDFHFDTLKECNKKVSELKKLARALQSND